MVRTSQEWVARERKSTKTDVMEWVREGWKVGWLIGGREGGREGETDRQTETEITQQRPRLTYMIRKNCEDSN